MRKLPVISAFSHALKSTWHNLPFAFHASWMWLLILVPISMWAESRIPTLDPSIDFKNLPPEQMMEFQKAALTFYLSMILSMVIYSSIAVNWHRYVLLDEVPMGSARLRLDKTVWRYVGNTILVFLMVVLLIMPLGLVFGILSIIAGGSHPALFAAYIAAVMLLALPATYRLSIKLPAIALEKQGFRFGDAWNASRGNMTQLILLGALAFAAVIAFGFALGSMEGLATRALGQSATWFFMLVRQLAGWRDSNLHHHHAHQPLRIFRRAA